jgi:hypothetical protein
MNRTLRAGLVVGLALAVWTANSAEVAGLPATATTPPAVDTRTLVWVADGAGGYGGCSQALSQASLECGTPIEVCSFPWSHGYRRVILDQMDLGHAREQGRRLAGTILQRKQCEPGRRMVVVSHSAGAAVVLSAGEALPPGSIDRMILLAPSVSRGYDVCPSLRASCEGIDVFCSKKDWLMLGVGARVVGTTDRYLGRAAGRHGFRERLVNRNCCNPCMLRHHFWTPEIAWTGHTGGHFGVHSPAFIQTYLFPLISPQVR